MNAQKKSCLYQSRSRRQRDWLLALSCGVGLLLPPLSFSQGLNSARVVSIVNEVWIAPEESVSPAPAKPNDRMGASGFVRTAKRSRAELEFKDMTMTRLGANTVFSFDRATRELHLQSGTMLIQVFDPQGKCKLRTDAVTAGITGTTLIAEVEGKTSRLFLLESKTPGVGVTLASGDKGLLRPGYWLVASTKPTPLITRTFDVRKKWKSCETGEAMGGLHGDAQKLFVPPTPPASATPPSTLGNQAALNAAKNAAQTASQSASKPPIKPPCPPPTSRPPCATPPPKPPTPPCTVPCP